VGKKHIKNTWGPIAIGFERQFIYIYIDTSVGRKNASQHLIYGRELKMLKKLQNL
jgi:hypothetical protein